MLLFSTRVFCTYLWYCVSFCASKDMSVSKGVEKETFNLLLHPAFINSIWNKEKLPQQWKESIIVPVYIRSVIKLIEVIIAVINYIQNCIQHSSLKANSVRR
jgi:hypothetical protein